jgi:hypothetical protein
MVYNTTRLAKIPFSNTTMKSHTKHVMGKGMGSVLLNTGGAGAASSYMDLMDYTHTTGRDPTLFQSKSGKGLESISKKLKDLKIHSGPKRKNIVMSF